MKKFLVIGNPIDHSLSPKLHNYWINENNIKALYEKLKLNGNDLRNLISQVKEKNIDGINVTVPFKRAVIPFLDQLTDEAEKTQSVNTIYLNDNKLTGHNTDIIGFEMSLKNFKYDLNNKEVFITSATKGMNRADLQKFKYSGSLFSVKSNINGMLQKKFTLNYAKKRSLL